MYGNTFIEEIIDRILLSRYTKRVLYGSLGVAIGVVWILFYFEYIVTIKDWAKLVVAPLVIFLSLILTARQFAYTREWNKKDAAIKAIYTSREKTYDYNLEVNSVLNTSKAVEDAMPLCIKKIHNAMGVFLEDGSFVFHKEQCDEDIQSIHNKVSSGYVREFDKELDGRLIERNITKILNEYEYICMGCNERIFDKETVKQLASGRVVASYNVFINYIYHQRDDTPHMSGNVLYEHFERFSKEIAAEKRWGLKILKPTNYKTPFQKKS